MPECIEITFLFPQGIISEGGAEKAFAESVANVGVQFSEIDYYSLVSDHRYNVVLLSFEEWDFDQVQFSFEVDEVEIRGTAAQFWNWITKVIDQTFSLLPMEFAFVSIESNNINIERYPALSSIDQTIVVEMTLSVANAIRSPQMDVNWNQLQNCNVYLNKDAQDWW